MINFGLLLLVALIATVLCGLSWFGARTRLPGSHRLPLDYALGLYTLTYAIGCVILFLFREDYIYRFYGGAGFVPGGISYWLILLVAVMPYIFVPWTVVALEALSGRRPHRPVARPPLRPEAVFGAILVVLAVSFVIISPVALLLIRNALSDLSATTSVAALYSQRQEIFEEVSLLQGGVIYSVLPPVAAIIMFWPAERRWLLRVTGLGLTVVALLLNLGMFQIGPTLAFLLVCAFCYTAGHQGRINFVAMGSTIALGIVALSLYSLVKAGSGNVGQVEVFLMRLPMPLPYLIQMASENAIEGGQSKSLAFELGEYMFPDTRSAHSFVAMPQPAFVDAWFTFNFVAGIAMLIFIGLLITIFGRLFAANGFGRPERDGRLILWSAVAAPALYYAFQVDLFNLFVSAYSITFCLIPAVAVLTLDAFLPRAAPAVRSHRQIRH